MTNNIKKTFFLLAAALLLQLAQGMAKEGRSITMDDAIRMGIANSNQLKLGNAKIAEATASLREAKERMLPDFSISGSYLRLSNPTVDLKLKLGGSAGTDTTGSSSSSGASSIQVNEAAYGIANISLPLFSGFRIRRGIESAKYLQKATMLDAEKDKDEVVKNIIAAYSNLYKAKAAEELVQENLKQSKQRVKDFENLERNGLMARNDLLKAQLQQSNVELALLDADNNYKIASINMSLMLGLPEEDLLSPDEQSFPAIDDTRGFTDWEQMALGNRQDAKALSYRAKAAAIGIKAAKAEYYPSLALTGGYIAAYVPNIITITNAINVGVGLKYSPSSLWKAGSKVAQAKAKAQQLAINEDILGDGIKLQVAQAYQNYLSSQKKIEVYNAAVAQANENYRITKNKYDNNLATTTDLLDADVAQLQAKLNYAFAKADAVVSYKNLQQSAGILADNQSNP